MWLKLWSSATWGSYWSMEIWWIISKLVIIPPAFTVVELPVARQAMLTVKLYPNQISDLIKWGQSVTNQIIAPLSTLQLVQCPSDQMSPTWDVHLLR